MRFFSHMHCTTHNVPHALGVKICGVVGINKKRKYDETWRARGSLINSVHTISRTLFILQSDVTCL